MTVIVDTNVLVAGLAARRPESATRLLLEAVRDGRITPLVSPALVAEYRDVLNRPSMVRLHGLQPPLPDRVVTELVAFAETLDPPRADLLAPDPDDQFLWDLLAASPNATLVTGERALLESEAFAGRILTARAVIDALASSTSR